MDNKLDKKTIKQLVEALRKYGSENGLSQEALAHGAGINISYINAMLADKIRIGNTYIAELYYRKVAEYIGYDLDKVYWKHREIDEHVEMFTELMDAKANGNMKIIINDSGYGKTYTKVRFKKLHAAQNYGITVSSLHTLRDVLEEIGEALHINNFKKSKVAQLRQIAAKFRNIKLSGRKPILIIDEAENLKVNTLKMIKALYDAISPYCSIVLIGTEDLIIKIDWLLDHKEPGIRQFYRRFKAGIRVIKNRDKEEIFEDFFEDVADDNLRKLLCTMCDNIGELHDELEPALRAADGMGVPLTEEFFKQLKNL